MKELKKPLILALGLTLPVSFAFAANIPDCTIENGAIVNQSMCYAQPDEYYTTIYQIGLCTSDPTAGNTLPTTNAGPNLGTCTTVYSSANANGDTVQVIKGVASSLPGTITRPSNGQYSYGYAVIGPQFQIKTSKSFNRDITAFGGGGSGRTCWTKASTQFVYADHTNQSDGAASNCGSSISGQGTTVQYMNSFDPFYNSQNQQQNPTYSTTTSGGLFAYLTTNDLKLGSNSGNSQMGTITRLFGVQPLSASVSGNTTGLNLTFNVSQGTTVIIQNNQSLLTYFGGGPFSIVFSLE